MMTSNWQFSKKLLMDSVVVFCFDIHFITPLYEEFQLTWLGKNFILTTRPTIVNKVVNGDFVDCWHSLFTAAPGPGLWTASVWVSAHLAWTGLSRGQGWGPAALLRPRPNVIVLSSSLAWPPKHQQKKYGLVQLKRIDYAPCSLACCVRKDQKFNLCCLKQLLTSFWLNC